MTRPRKKSRRKRDSNPGSSALEADALPLGQRGGRCRRPAGEGGQWVSGLLSVHVWLSATGLTADAAGLGAPRPSGSGSLNPALDPAGGRTTISLSLSPSLPARREHLRNLPSPPPPSATPFRSLTLPLQGDLPDFVLTRAAAWDSPRQSPSLRYTSMLLRRCFVPEIH